MSESESELSYDEEGLGDESLEPVTDLRKNLLKVGVYLLENLKGNLMVISLLWERS